MRRFLTFDCCGHPLQATLDDAGGPLGLMIVSGGTEPRNGARGVQSRLAQDLAQQGISCFRFDRRGIGDSAGDDLGFAASLPDILAAIQAFRTACPRLRRIAAYGNCDAATVLLTGPIPGIDQIILSNIWVGVPEDGLAPPQLLRRQFGRVLWDASLWQRLRRSKLNLGHLWAEARRAVLGAPLPDWAPRVAAGLAAFPGHIDILLAQGDMTAQRFEAALAHRDFRAVRAKANLNVMRIDTDSHSFVQDDAYQMLRAALAARLGCC